MAGGWQSHTGGEGILLSLKRGSLQTIHEGQQMQHLIEKLCGIF